MILTRSPCYAAVSASKSMTNCHQRGVNQAVRITLALCRQREDTLGQLGPARSRSLLRSEARPRVV